MHWQVTNSEGKDIDIDAISLLDLLISKHLSKEKLDFQELALAFVKFLQDKQSLHETNPLQLVYMAFAIGYYYRLFLEKNNVEVVSDSQTTVQSNSNTNGS